jgi:hypothetical protein
MTGDGILEMTARHSPVEGTGYDQEKFLRVTKKMVLVPGLPPS